MWVWFKWPNPPVDGARGSSSGPTRLWTAEVSSLRQDSLTLVDLPPSTGCAYLPPKLPTAGRSPARSRALPGDVSRSRRRVGCDGAKSIQPHARRASADPPAAPTLEPGSARRRKPEQTPCRLRRREKHPASRSSSFRRSTGCAYLPPKLPTAGQSPARSRALPGDLSRSRRRVGCDGAKVTRLRRREGQRVRPSAGRRRRALRQPARSAPRCAPP